MLPHIVIHFVDIILDRVLFAARRAAKQDLASADAKLYFLTANLAFYNFHSVSRQRAWNIKHGAALCDFSHSTTSSLIDSSLSWVGVTREGASVMRQIAFCVLGKAITSRID